MATWTQWHTVEDERTGRLLSEAPSYQAAQRAAQCHLEDDGEIPPLAIKDAGGRTVAHATLYGKRYADRGNPPASLAGTFVIVTAQGRL